MTFWMSTADWMELQAYRATGLTPDAVQEMVSFPYTADDDEEVNKLIANQCVVCGAEMPEGDQVCTACRNGSSKVWYVVPRGPRATKVCTVCRAGNIKSAIAKITTRAEFLENLGEKQMAAELAGAVRALKGDRA